MSAIVLGLIVLSACDQPYLSASIGEVSVTKATDGIVSVSATVRADGSFGDCPEACLDVTWFEGTLPPITNANDPCGSLPATSMQIDKAKTCQAGVLREFGEFTVTSTTPMTSTNFVRVQSSCSHSPVECDLVSGK
jgi:hypothetical protein